MARTETVTTDDALAWAGSIQPFETSETITERPWATTLRLTGSGGSSYLKILKSDVSRRARLLNSISDHFGAETPRLFASDESAGFLLYQDHGGDDLGRSADASSMADILVQYAKLQSVAPERPSLSASLPVLVASDQFSRLMRFLVRDPSSGPALDGSVDASFFVGERSAGRYARVFGSVERVFRDFLATADSLPITINHCDLRPQNVARRPDGSLTIFDWDDAVLGPPGLSLHTFFSGCTRPCLALSEEEPKNPSRHLAEDRELLSAYLDQLSLSQKFPRPRLAAALPAAICAGVINYIAGFGEYPIDSDRLREKIGKSIRRRLSDLINLAQHLVRSDDEARKQLIAALEETGRTKRAAALKMPATDQGKPNSKRAESLSSNVAPRLSELEREIAESDRDGVFPAIDVSDEERETARLSLFNRSIGPALFERHGTLLIKNAFSPDLIANCRENFEEQYDRYLKDEKHDDALRVGDKRFMITLKFAPPFGDPALFASPMILPIMRRLLGKELILGSLTCVASLPGSKVQRMHKDHVALFKEQPELRIPAFAVTMIVPLVNLNEVNGATRVIKGSHRVTSDAAKTMPYQDPVIDVGSCFLMDFRLSHQGMANNSDKPRPITSVVYQRPWFRDYVNYGKQKPLDVESEAVANLPADLASMVDWALGE